MPGKIFRVSTGSFTKFQNSFQIDFGKSFRKIPWVTTRIFRSSRLWTQISLSGIRFAVISRLGAPTRHLLMPRDSFQLSSLATSQYSKIFLLEKFPKNPLSHSLKVCPYGSTILNLNLLILKLSNFWSIVFMWELCL